MYCKWRLQKRFCFGIVSVGRRAVGVAGKAIYKAARQAAFPGFLFSSLLFASLLLAGFNEFSFRAVQLVADERKAQNEEATSGPVGSGRNWSKFTRRHIYFPSAQLDVEHGYNGTNQMGTNWPIDSGAFLLDGHKQSSLARFSRRRREEEKKVSVRALGQLQNPPRELVAFTSPLLCSSREAKIESILVLIWLDKETNQEVLRFALLYFSSLHFRVAQLSIPLNLSFSSLSLSLLNSAQAN